MAKCPYVKGKKTGKYTKAVLEGKQDKHGNFLVSHPLVARFWEHDVQTKTSSPLVDLAIVLTEPDKSSLGMITGPTGLVMYTPEWEGDYFFSFYDKYGKRHVYLRFTAKEEESARLGKLRSAITGIREFIRLIFGRGQAKAKV